MNEHEEPSHDNENKEELTWKRQELHLEYQECGTLSRFIMGLRFTFFASFITLFIVLIGGYYHVWSADDQIFGALQPYLLFMISFFGIMTAIVASAIEIRNIEIGNMCDRHAAEIEESLGIRDGIYQKILQWTFGDIKIPLTQPLIVYGLYVAILFIWFLLSIYSIYHLWIHWTN